MEKIVIKKITGPCVSSTSKNYQQKENSNLNFFGTQNGQKLFLTWTKEDYIFPITSLNMGQA